MKNEYPAFMTLKKSESGVDTQDEYWAYAQLFDYLLNKGVSITNKNQSIDEKQQRGDSKPVSN